MPDTVTKPKVTWRAGSDRISHGSLPRAARSLCGERVVLERNAWPQLRPCMACSMLAADLVGPAR